MKERLRRPNLLESQTMMVGLGIFHHHAVGARFEKIRRREAVVNVESIHREKQKIGGDVPQRIFGERSDQRKRIPSQHAAR